MAKYIGAENSEVWLVPAIASTSAPTVTEMDGGTAAYLAVQSGVSTGTAWSSGDIIDQVFLPPPHINFRRTVEFQSLIGCRQLIIAVILK